MSFAGTPLGQGRRLDHNTFFGKPPSNSNTNNTTRPPSPQHRVPTSFSYGAPTLPSRSPTHDPALSRFNRIKQSEPTARAGRPGAPKIFTEQPDPKNWSVKDTTVQIAAAFNQAVDSASSTAMQNPHNASWASSSRTIVPRNTSVEYETEAQNILNRRGAQARNSNASSVGRGGKPLSKTGSASLGRIVPDSEGEDNSQYLPPQASTRGKSPLLQTAMDAGARVVGAATFYMRQRSQEPQDVSGVNGNDPSYDYSAEERDFQSTQASKKSNTSHKKNRMSMDNKAYKPSKDSEEDTDEEISDDGRKRRRKGAKKGPAGVMNRLPVIQGDKQRKRKKKTGAGGEEDEDEESISDELESQRRDRPLSVSSRQSAQRTSVPRNTADHSTSFDASMENSLPSIPEDQEMSYEGSQDQQQQPQGSIFSAAAGRLIYYGVTSVRWCIYMAAKLIYLLLFGLGRLFGLLSDIFYLKPKQKLKNAPIVPFIWLIVLASIGWYAYQHADQFPSLIPRRTYHAPGAPPADISELNARLLKLESVLESIAADSERLKTQAEYEAQQGADVASRLGSLESRVQKENNRVMQAETRLRESTSVSLGNLKQELEELQAKFANGIPPSSSEGAAAAGVDAEARRLLKSLEERVGTVESEAREALDLGKNAVKTGGDSSWWNKLGSSKGSALTIKSSDGQDVSSLISHMVDSAVSAMNKDTLAKADFALYSAGGRVIPTLTSSVLKIRGAKASGWLTGMFRKGELATGRPPVTALHHETHSGYCWPFAGSEGQLGVALAAPAHISEVTIDHVSKDVAFDLRSAPREMELWGLVEGKDNMAKVKEWQARIAERRAIAFERGEPVEDEEPYPALLPKKPEYIKIASFTYNIHSPYNVQTFPVLDEIRDLGVDFGIVVLRMKNNWGMDDFTCLYRLRVHGEKLGDTPLPFPEDFDDSQASS